jgi:DNA replication protein DnaC
MDATSKPKAASADEPKALGDADLLRDWPDEPPSWLLPDDPASCPRCLDTGVEVLTFRTAAEYCAHYGVAEEDLTARERGWFARAEAGGAPVTMARPCECVAARERERRFREAVAGLPRALAAARFDGVRCDVPYKAEALARARAFVERMKGGEDGGVLVLAGATGTGKTYVAVATLRAAVDARLRATLITSAEFCDDVRERSYSVADVRRYVDDLRRHDLVVLDDFGSERVGPAEGTVLDHYARFLKSFEAGGALIITTNLDIQQALTARFGDEGDRIARRLGEVQFGPALRFGAGAKEER